ncbi:hypothetical protein ZWY2020_052103 [Hordeum vulgare]|nr:hypothetical protein ZWY2020_052103 [Hordeum vulgare]
MESFLRWLKDAAPIALTYVLDIAAIVCVADLVWYCAQILCTATVEVARALGRVLCFCRECLIAFDMWVVKCCTRVTMVTSGVTSALISRRGFVANPRLYFKILRLAGPIVATVVSRGAQMPDPASSPTPLLVATPRHCPRATTPLPVAR